MPASYRYRFTSQLGLPASITDVVGTLEDLLGSVGLVSLAYAFTEPSWPSRSTDTGDPESTDDALDAEGLPEEDETYTGPEPADFSSPVTVGADEYFGTGTLTVTLEALSEVVVEIPWFDGVSLALNPGTFDVVVTMSDGDFGIEFETDLAVRFSADYLPPVKSTDGWITYQPDASRTYTQITVASARVSIDSAGGVSFDSDAGIALADAVMIGETGVIVESADIELNIDGTGTRPAGTPEGWKGLLINSAVVRVPEVFAGSFSATGLGFGSSGVSGTIEGHFPLTCTGGSCTGDLASGVLGIEGGISDISLTLQQNIPSAGSITAQAYLPFFNPDNPVHLDIGVASDGNFDVALAADRLDPDGLYSLSIGDFATLRLSSVGFGNDAGTAYVELGGTLALGTVAGFDLPDLSVDGLRVTADGKISLTGGGITLESQEALDFHGFQIEIDAVGFGSEGRENYVSVSGGVKLTEGLPVGASAKGLRIYWDPNAAPEDILDSLRVTLEGIGVEFTIPDTLTFAGEVSYSESLAADSVTELHQFEGSIDLRIIPADLQITARLIVGETSGGADTYKYFYIEADAQLPTGIPLASTGTALYGFSGLIASNMEPTHTDAADFNWYEDWYVAGQPWNPEAGAFGLGVGTTLGTQADNGYIFATRIAFVITFPGPIIMLQGTGNILKERAKLSPDPADNIFSSLIVFDGSAKTLLAVMSMAYQLPETPSGMILDASASSEAFFDFDDPSNSHVYMGEEDEDKRIRAEVFRLFRADSYLMIDSERLKAGTSIGIDERYDFEIVEIVLKAMMSGEAEITWAPQHLAGRLQFEGELTLRAFDEFDFSLTADASVAGATPHDFSLDATLHVTLDVPKPFKDIEVDLEFSWRESHAAAAIAPVLASCSVRAYKTSDSWNLVLRDGTTYGSGHDDAWFVDDDGGTLAVPLDSRPLLLFNRNVHDETGIGTPAPDVSDESAGNDTFTYRLTRLELHKWNGTAWEAVPDVTGSWQATGDEAGTQLELYGDGPFSFTRETTTGSSTSSSPDGSWSTPWIDSYLSLAGGYPFDTTLRRVDFTAYAAGDNLGSAFTHEEIDWNGWMCGTSPPVALDVEIVSGAQESIRIGPTTATAAGDSVTAKWSFCLEALFPEPARIAEVAVFSDRPDRAAHLTALATKSDGTTVGKTFELLNGQHAYALDAACEDAVAVSFSSDGCYLEGLAWVAMSDLHDAFASTAQATALATTARATLEPECDYRITVTTVTDAVVAASSTVDWCAFFRTSGPPTDLTPYVDRTVLANGGDPHYGAYDLQIVFNENYLNELYGSALELRVYDENGDEVDASYTSGWRHVAASSEPAYYLSAWISAVAVAAGGASATPMQTDEATPDTLYAWLAAGASLPADKLLTAKILYDGDEIWSTTFRTSSYAGVAELVADMRGTAWAETFESADWSFTAADAFDDVWYERIGGTPRSTPARAELTALKDATGAVRALLVELPEPVDWDRLTLTITAPDGSTIAPAAIVNDDSSRALLTTSTSWSVGPYTLELSYQLASSGLDTLYRNSSLAMESVSVLVTVS